MTEKKQSKEPIMHWPPKGYRWDENDQLVLDDTDEEAAETENVYRHRDVSNEVRPPGFPEPPPRDRRDDG